MRKWIALFSRSGSELVKLCSSIQRYPDVTLTNGKEENCVYEGPVLRMQHNKIMDYLRNLDDNYLITLHGYLRIIPADVCQKHTEMYNGHPALITRYPELKGKDKQEDVFLYKEKYSQIGVVIHRVVPELDSGRVCVSLSAPNDVESIDDAYNKLATLSLKSWEIAFKQRIIG